MVGEHDVSVRDADPSQRLGAVVGVGGRGDAQRERQGVGRRPGDLGDHDWLAGVRVLDERVIRGGNGGELDGTAARRIGVLSGAGQRALDLLEDQHVAGLERARRAQ